jgi:hypothetical protein
VSRAAYEERGAALVRQQVSHEVRCADLRERIAVAEQRYADALAERVELLAKYHELRQAGQSVPIPTQPMAMPADPLGPLSHAALDEMGLGLPHANRRAQETKARAYAATHNDEDTARYIRRGDLKAIG